VKVQPLTDIPGRLENDSKVLLRGEEAIIREHHHHRQGLVLGFEGIDRLEQAEELTGELLSVSQHLVPALDEGFYYHFQILGLKAWSSKGDYLGEVKDILLTGANDVYVVADEDRELLVPAIDDVIKNIDLEQGQIIIELIDGL
jgi:16S rRNA processing protein RimM